ncbi:unnamed protein product [Allacma fusca]|uniref:Uncharacterized protein n=1 Tax=Allacma fusca TaxID=39272 RepID=A0A8J2JGF0_9HEXA|nr:unnamed protein product [Allacma fusca]
MVRILTCHHFGGQKITKCEEALQLTIADDYIVVALEHQVAVYSSELLLDDFSYLGKAGFSRGATRDGGDIGSSPIYFDRAISASSEDTGVSDTNTKKESEIKFSHSFPTVDLIDSICYNRRGNYLLCLEKRESTAGDNNKRVVKNVRLYFNWDRTPDGKPMRARIAGLVSPTGAEPDDETLVMIEIPPPTQPTSNNAIPGILSVSSCNILGHLATLTDASTVNIYSYRLKDTKNRANKNPYPDFDFSYSVEIFSFGLEQAKITFLADFVSIWNPSQVSVFRLLRHNRPRTRSISNESDRSGSSGGRRSVNSGNFGYGPGPSPVPSHKEDLCDRVVFDSKNESVKVHMNVITRANHKRRFPDMGAGIYEEFQEEIGLQTKSRLVYSTSSSPLLMEDLLRVFLGPEQQNTVVQVGLYAIKIKDDLGGVSCVLGTSSQAFVYHLPVRRDATVTRVVTYPLTAPLVSFAFDSMFFHALTETGLETYTSRSLYYPLKDFEGFQRYKNDCPFLNETPSLIGIRPFMGVRFMAANELILCLLSSPANSNTSTSAGASSEDSLWTIYALQLPNVEMLYEDMSKAAILAKSANPETFVTLTSELHLVLRTFMNTNPDMESIFLRRYQKTCRSIGIEHFKVGAGLLTEATRMSEGTDKYMKEALGDDHLDKGVTYLSMAGTDLRHIFEEDPNTFIRDKKMIKGVTRFINVAIPEYVDSVATSLSPKLAAVVTDFLVVNSPESLVQLVINVPILRESNSAKLIQILKKMAETSNFKIEESIALLLTLVTMSGCDAITRGQVREILSKCKATDVESSFHVNWILDLKNLSKPKITDLTVCLSASQSSIPTHVICQGLEYNEVSVGQVMMAFSQGINLNSDMEVQQALTRTLTNILEKFFTGKLNRGNISIRPKQLPFNLSTIETKTNLENDLISNKVISAQPISLQFNDEETHAVKALVRSYISHITLKPPTQGTTQQRRNSGDKTASKDDRNKTEGKKTKKGGTTAPVLLLQNRTNSQANDVGVNPEPMPVLEDTLGRPANFKQDGSSLNKNTLSEGKLTPFGKVPNFLVHIIKDTQSHINTNLTAFQVLINLPMHNEETREFFIKLSSLLASPLGSTPGIRDIVLNFLETKGLPGSTLHVCLQMLAEPCEKAIVTLIAKYPLALMYYAKEMFGRSTSKWKILVTKLKEKIYSNSDDVEIYATIIESVYLFLANTLTPTELEEVLDKEEENTRFFKACLRTELANSYSQMILQMSNEYL